MEFIYTPQQLAGYKGYNARVRIGNWSEDVEQENSRLQDYLYKKDRGLLKCTQAEQRFSRALAPVELKGSSDGMVHFGEDVMLFNQKTDGCIACDLEEQVSGGYPAWTATTTWYTEPCNRTTFRIVPYHGPGDKKDNLFVYADNCLHFGQKFMLQVNPNFSAQNTYLASYAKSPTRFARYSREQEVCVTTEDSWHCVFEVVCLDPQYKLEMEGQPIQANAPFAIMHLATRTYLASDKVTYRNDFGAEYELFGKTYMDIQKGQLGSRDRKLLGEQNRFCFVNAVGDGQQQ